MARLCSNEALRLACAPLCNSAAAILIPDNKTEPFKPLPAGNTQQTGTACA
jgi:hypothetical protein